MTQAALPILREQGSGHIIQVSSIGGVKAFPTLGLYHASKWGLEGFSQSLAAEVARLRDQGHDRRAGRLLDRLGAARRPSRPSTWPPTTACRERREQPRAATPAGRGDPEATGPAILELVDADEPPLRVFFGIGPLDIIRGEYAQRIATWEQWDDLSRAAHGASATAGSAR